MKEIKVVFAEDGKSAVLTRDNCEATPPFSSRSEIEVMLYRLQFNNEITMSDLVVIVGGLEKSVPPFNDIPPLKNIPDVSVGYFNPQLGSKEDFNALIEQMIDKRRNSDSNKPWFPHRNAPVLIDDQPMFKMCEAHKNDEPHAHIS